jgi:hypothetical protein
MNKPNELNQIQKQYLKNIMDLNIDYVDFKSLSADSIIAINMMNQTELRADQWRKHIDSFMNSYNTLKQIRAKISK